MLFYTWKGEKIPTESSRQTVKADCQILGTAVANGASVIYSEDTDILKIAGIRIKVLPIPRLSQQELDLS
jgi:hypothetical protein